jgi:hypothetical protein
MDGTSRLSKVVVLVATLAIAGVASYQIVSHVPGAGAGASPFAPATGAGPASEKAPDGEPPSNDIADFQQLD